MEQQYTEPKISRQEDEYFIWRTVIGKENNFEYADKDGNWHKAMSLTPSGIGGTYFSDTKELYKVYYRMVKVDG